MDPVPNHSSYLRTRYVIADVPDDAFFNEYSAAFEDILASEYSDIFDHERSYSRLTGKEEKLAAKKDGKGASSYMKKSEL